VAVQTWLAVALGGAVGSLLRHAVNMFVSRRFVQSVPFSTAAVNLIGCLTIGFLAGLIAGSHWRVGTVTRSFVFVGILGGFTTFSSFGLDTLTLVHEGRSLAALVNVLVQVGVGLTAVFAGFAIGTR